MRLRDQQLLHSTPLQQ